MPRGGEDSLGIPILCHLVETERQKYMGVGRAETIDWAESVVRYLERRTRGERYLGRPQMESLGDGAVRVPIDGGYKPANVCSRSFRSGGVCVR